MSTSMARLRRTEVLAPEPVESLAGVLDLEAPGDGTVPPLWHWLYLLDRRPERDLGPDGHPRHGIPAPPGPGRRRMFAGGSVTSHALLRLGEEATRTTWVAATRETQGSSGPLTFVTVRVEIEQRGRLAVAEEQDIVYRAPRRRQRRECGAERKPAAEEPRQKNAADPAAEEPRPRQAEPSLELDVTPVLLFRFSALTYNAHRIHYDREWVRHEGYADLVVHGPLQALLMGELARRHGISLLGREFAYRLVAPMVGPQRLRVQAGEDGLDAGAETRTATGHLTAVSTLRRA
jgi:3-methylfumaryl-CoA hydratase